MSDSNERLEQIEKVLDDLKSENYVRTDERLDKLEMMTASLERALAEVRKPWYKTGGFKGSAIGILAAFGLWAYSFFQSDPELPRLLHQNLLMSDKALALMIQRDIDNPESTNVLSKQVGRKADVRLKADDAQEHISNIAMEVFNSEPSQKKIYKIAATQAARTYSEARIFRRQELSLGSVRCQMISDPELWNLLSKVKLDIPNVPPHRIPALTQLENACEGEANNPSNVIVPFFNTSPMVIPYIANPGDDVEVEVQVISNSWDENGNLDRSANGQAFLEVTHEQPNRADGGGIAFAEQDQGNVFRKSFEAPSGDKSHLVFVQLSDRGLQKLSGKDDTLIVVFATVTVLPGSNLEEG